MLPSSPISGQPIEITLTVIGSANRGTHFFACRTGVPPFRHSVGNTNGKVKDVYMWAAVYMWGPADMHGYTLNLVLDCVSVSICLNDLLTLQAP